MCISGQTPGPRSAPLTTWPAGATAVRISIAAPPIGPEVHTEGDVGGGVGAVDNPQTEPASDLGSAAESGTSAVTGTDVSIPIDAWPRHGDLLAPPADNPAWDVRGKASGLVLYRLGSDSRVWLLEPADLTTQARALNRLAWLLEHGGPTDPAPAPETLARWHREHGRDPLRLRIAHDLTLAELRGLVPRLAGASATAEPEEAALLSLLRDHGVLTESPPAGVLLVVSRPSPGPAADTLTPAQHRALLRHELSHAVFALHPAYRDYCLAFWHGLRADLRTAITAQLGRWHYDTSDPARLANELQAYLFEAEMGAFVDARLRPLGASLARLRQDFLAGLAGRKDGAGWLFQWPHFAEVLARGPAWQVGPGLVKRSLGPPS